MISLFFDGVVRRAVEPGLTSDEHFSVDGTLIESYASMKSLKPLNEQDARGDGDGDNGGRGGKVRKTRSPRRRRGKQAVAGQPSPGR